MLNVIDFEMNVEVGQSADVKLSGRKNFGEIARRFFDNFASLKSPRKYFRDNGGQRKNSILIDNPNYNVHQLEYEHLQSYSNKTKSTTNVNTTTTSKDIGQKQSHTLMGNLQSDERKKGKYNRTNTSAPKKFYTPGKRQAPPPPTTKLKSQTAVKSHQNEKKVQQDGKNTKEMQLNNTFPSPKTESCEHPECITEQAEFFSIIEPNNTLASPVSPLIEISQNLQSNASSSDSIFTDAEDIGIIESTANETKTTSSVSKEEKSLSATPRMISIVERCFNSTKKSQQGQFNSTGQRNIELTSTPDKLVLPHTFQRRHSSSVNKNSTDSAVLRRVASLRVDDVTKDFSKQSSPTIRKFTPRLCNTFRGQDLVNLLVCGIPEDFRSKMTCEDSINFTTYFYSHLNAIGLLQPLDKNLVRNEIWFSTDKLYCWTCPVTQKISNGNHNEEAMYTKEKFQTLEIDITSLQAEVERLQKLVDELEKSNREKQGMLVAKLSKASSQILFSRQSSVDQSDKNELEKSNKVTEPFVNKFSRASSSILFCRNYSTDLISRNVSVETKRFTTSLIDLSKISGQECSKNVSAMQSSLSRKCELEQKTDKAVSKITPTSKKYPHEVEMKTNKIELDVKKKLDFLDEKKDEDGVSNESLVKCTSESVNEKIVKLCTPKSNIGLVVIPPTPEISSISTEVSSKTPISECKVMTSSSPPSLVIDANASGSIPPPPPPPPMPSSSSYSIQPVTIPIPPSPPPPPFMSMDVPPPISTQSSSIPPPPPMMGANVPRPPLPPPPPPPPFMSMDVPPLMPTPSVSIPPPPPMMGANVPRPPLPPTTLGINTTLIPPPPMLGLLGPSLPTPGGPAALPPPPPGGWNPPGREQMRKKPVEPEIPMKPLFWSRILLPATETPIIPATTPDAPPKVPLWVELEEEKSVNIEEFIDLFSRQIIERKPTIKKEDSKLQKIQYAKILDTNRSKNVGILEKSLRVDFSEVENAIYNLDTSIVSLEVLKQIYEVMPSAKEIKDITTHESEYPDIPLDRPEMFLKQLSSIKYSNERIVCLMCQSEFQDALSTVSTKLTNLRTTCDFLMNSKSLKKVMALILTLGNYMNGGNRTRGQADGFGLEILDKLKDVKSKHPGVTLLHYLVRTILQQNNVLSSDEMLPLPIPELADIQAASDIDFEIIAKELDRLDNELKICKKNYKVVVDNCPESAKVFKEKMDSFMETSNHELLNEKEYLQEAKIKFKAVMLFYQYIPKGAKIDTAEPKDFFVLWISFCRDFKDIWKKEHQRMRKEKVKILRRKTQQIRENEISRIQPSGLKNRLLKKLLEGGK